MTNPLWPPAMFAARSANSAVLADYRPAGAFDQAVGVEHDRVAHVKEFGAHRETRAAAQRAGAGRLDVARVSLAADEQRRWVPGGAVLEFARGEVERSHAYGGRPRSGHVFVKAVDRR